MVKKFRSDIIRCESWCRHYFKSGGDAMCTYNGGKVLTEKGAQCLGRREVLSRKKTEEERRTAWKNETKRRKAESLDKRCRKNCIYLKLDTCTFGPEPAYTEPGAQCIGKKTIRKKKSSPDK